MFCFFFLTRFSIFSGFLQGFGCSMSFQGFLQIFCDFSSLVSDFQENPQVSFEVSNDVFRDLDGRAIDSKS